MGDAERQREILLAEDSPADAHLVRFALREYGRRPYRLHVVTDGGERWPSSAKKECTRAGPGPSSSL